MFTATTTRRVWRRMGRTMAVAVLPLSLIAATNGANAATTTSTTPPIVALTPPAIPGVASLPGPIAPAATLSPTVGVLTINPLAGGPVGSTMNVTGSGLAPNASVQLTWDTVNATWTVDPEPNTVNYMGRATTNVTVVLGTATTDATGKFSFTRKVPNDFGGTHQIYAVINGVEVAEGAFVITRTLTVTPRSGPIGTPIKITYTGMGSALFQASASLLWDNHITGELVSEWTRGTGTTTIYAAGPVGTHEIMVGDALTFLYLNPIQSPYPFMNGAEVAFHVTKDNGPAAPSITWPVSVTPTLASPTTLQPGQLDPASSATAKLSQSSGPVKTVATLSVTGLSTTGADQVVWATESGSRVDCNSVTGQGCWVPVSTPLGTATPVNGAFTMPVTVPDGLGGWHMVLVMSGTKIEAQVPFYVKESIVPFYNKSGALVSQGVATASKAPSAFAAGNSGVGTYTFKQGQEFTISLKGVGWTQLDNTLTVDYDNSYIGYGCGFNSNGYLVIHLFATGGVGTHIIDLHPMLYTSQPAFANTPFGLAPVLTAGNDYPGLALGYQIPSMHFSIRIVK
ncbi:MAG: hypothetical protein HIU84_06510 [Acidobacteria bacterium]|nr:hypothetical protein [Acidobacteriota bacterium]